MGPQGVFLTGKKKQVHIILNMGDFSVDHKKGLTKEKVRGLEPFGLPAGPKSTIWAPAAPSDLVFVRTEMVPIFPQNTYFTNALLNFDKFLDPRLQPRRAGRAGRLNPRK